MRNYHQIAELDNELEELEITLNMRALLDSYRSSIFGFTYDIISVPTIILTLIVTIAAGGFGSLVYFSKLYLDQNNGVELKVLLSNIGQGIAASIAIFLLAGAGMLMLSGGSGQTDNQELSPYLVAAIAFVSGFLAEDAFQRIQTAGRNLLGTSGQAPVPVADPAVDPATPGAR